MLFHSPEFLFLALVTLGLFAWFPRLRLPVLAVANALFYAVSDFSYLMLFLAVSLLTYLCALRLHRTGERWVLTLGIALNVLNLATFKYSGFLLQNASALLRFEMDPVFLRLILPIGISFYTFQLIAYLVDVYRRELEPSRSFLEFWVFMSFFGQLIAGPIMRGEDFLPQIQSAPQQRLVSTDIYFGLYLFALGLVKKILLADLLGPQTNALFGQWAALNGLEAWMAGFLFAFQIYYDFSAYSDMAVGTGLFFGFRLRENFRTPYLSANPSEFWSRWHITLSRWIRDYIYIPLGGNRQGEGRAYLNLVMAMTLSGLWHGAAWTFLVWGLYHGVLSSLHKLWSRHVVERFSPGLGALRWVSVLLMFLATTVGWILFRAPSWEVAVHMLTRMAQPSTFQVTQLTRTVLPFVLIPALLHVGEFWLRHHERPILTGWARWVPVPVRSLAYTALAAVLIIVARIGETSFIYFRF